MDASSQRSLDHALALLKGLTPAKGLYELGRRTTVAVSALLAGPGGSAVLGRVNLAPAVLGLPDWQLAGMLAHELVHVRQGIRFFGDLQSECEAFATQRRVELAILAERGSEVEAERQRLTADLAALESGSDSARAWVLRQSAVYATFPDVPPRPWQVRRWWPQVRFAVGAALGRSWRT